MQLSEETINSLSIRAARETIEVLESVSSWNDDNRPMAIDGDVNSLEDPLEKILLELYSLEKMNEKALIMGDLLAFKKEVVWTKLSFVSLYNRPTLFYDQYPELKDLAKALHSMVAYSENEEVFGVAAINPIMAEVFKSQIESVILDRKGFTPFVQIFQIEYEAWIEMKRKHFGL